MRRAVSSLALFTLIMTAALFPGAAVFAQGSGVCGIDRSSTLLRLHDIDLVVTASIQAGSDADTVIVRPELYLKGAATGEDVELQRPDAEPGCALAELAAGDRVLVLLMADHGVYQWPAVEEAYMLEDGRAIRGEPVSDEAPEDTVVDDIREVTGQAAVAAGESDEGASIEWLGTVLPVTVALFIVLGIGLVMMREWHRIDPT